MKMWTLLVKAFRMTFVRTEDDSTAIVSDAQSEKGPQKKQPRIRCPACGWQPDGKPYWGCERCFVAFDTFKTHAHCPTPGCGNSWTYTQCIACGIQSLHEAWYEETED